MTRTRRAKLSQQPSWDADGREVRSILITPEIQLCGSVSKRLLMISALQGLSLDAVIRIRQILAYLSPCGDFIRKKLMSFELFTICFTFGHQVLQSLCLAVEGWSDEVRLCLKPGYPHLPPLLSNFETLIFNALFSLPAAAVPPGLFHPLVQSACSAPPRICCA